MSGLQILISGAGVAGPVLAFFLARAGARVTIVEKAPALRTGGQNVDIRGVGLKVLRRMGVEADVLRRTTKEEGVAFVDALDRKRAMFPVDPSGKNLSMTAEIEIMRGDLGRIFYDATRNDVEYTFGNSIENMVEKDEKVHVSFRNGSRQEYDFVFAADGLGSPTRGLIFGEDKQKSAIKSLGQYVAWFTITRHKSDGMWARWYNAPGRRMILLRPDTKSEASQQITRASLWICSNSAKLQGYSKLTIAEQKALMHEIFHDAGWEAPRVLADMDTADDFYLSEVAQVKMEETSWSNGRMAVLGDAGYCPSPISGMGTTVAIVGAYILAGEIARNPKDPKAAFASYEQLMRPFVTKAQKLIPGAPQLINPETAWGIWFMNSILGLVSWTAGLQAFLGRFAGPPVDAIVLPEYEMNGLGET
jgi:2-polyprenyl-6-methoxyphenol hydroxylase-like FAD-dependent oxidoreductase